MVDRTKLSLDFGVLNPTEERRIAVMVKNTSRRYLELAIAGPVWVHLAEQPVRFLPGEEREITFIACANTSGSVDMTAGAVEIRVNGKRVGTVRVSARRKGWLPFSWPGSH